MISAAAKTAATAAALTASIVGGAAFVEDRYENESAAEQTKQHLASVEFKVDEKIVSDQLWLVTQKKWQAEDRLDKKPADPALKQQVRELEAEEAQLNRKLNELKKSQP